MRLVRAPSLNRWPAPRRSLRDSSHRVPSAGSTTSTIGVVLYTASTLAIVMRGTLRVNEWSYANRVRTLWLFVTFGDSGSRKQHGHERGEGGELENPC